MSTLGTIAFMIPGAIKAGYENATFRKKLYQLENGVYYYYDRKGKTYEGTTGKRLYISSVNAVDEDGKVWWDKIEEENKRIKTTAIRRRLGGYIAYIPRCNNRPGLIEFETGKVIARLERNLEGECKKYYMYDSMAHRYSEDDLKYCCTLPSPKFCVRSGDKGIKITEYEFERLKNTEKYIGYCVDVIDEKDDDYMIPLYGLWWRKIPSFKARLDAIAKANGTYVEEEK